MTSKTVSAPSDTDALSLVGSGGGGGGVGMGGGGCGFCLTICSGFACDLAVLSEEEAASFVARGDAFIAVARRLTADAATTAVQGGANA